MKKIVFLFVFFASICQAQYVTVQSTQLSDSAGNRITGTICFRPTDGNGNPISFSATNGTTGVAATISRAVCTAVVNGVMSVPLADTALTTKKNICYATTITPNTGSVYNLTSCLQPASTGVAWCNTSTCNLDQADLSTINQYTVAPPRGAVGPVGPAGPSGSFTQAGFLSATAYGSSFSAMMTDTSTANSTITISAQTALPNGNTVVSSDRNIEVLGGGQFTCPTGTCTLVLSGGDFTAPSQKVVFGTNAFVTNLKIAHPIWIGAKAISVALENSLASPSTVILDPGYYSSAFYSSTGSTCWTRSNVTFVGAGNPQPNSGHTQLGDGIVGTVIQGGMSFAGANNIKMIHLGLDDGANFAVTSTTDALNINGASNCSGTNVSGSDPLITGTDIEDVSLMLSSGSVAYHAFLMEHQTGSIWKDITAYYGVHGGAFKSISSTLDNFTSYGNGSECATFKADTYTSTAHIRGDRINCETLDSSNVLNNGIIIDAEQAAFIQDIHLLHVNVTDARSGLTFVSNGTFGLGAVNTIDISDFVYSIINTSLGISNSSCVASNGASGQIAEWIHASHLTCQNGIVPGNAFAPFYFSMPIYNASFNDTFVIGSDSSGSTIQGLNLFFSNYKETNATEGHSFYITGNSHAYMSDYNSPIPFTPAVDSGSSFASDGASGINSGVVISNTATDPFCVDNAARNINFFCIDSSGNGQGPAATFNLLALSLGGGQLITNTNNIVQGTASSGAVCTPTKSQVLVIGTTSITVPAC